jgi:uncharacterized protein DUF1905
MGRPGGGHSIAIPFDPSVACRERDQYHVHGTVGGNRFRGALVKVDGGWFLQLGPAWCRAPGFQPGDEVEVVMSPKGPQSTTMGDDVSAAVAGETGGCQVLRFSAVVLPQQLRALDRERKAPGDTRQAHRRDRRPGPTGQARAVSIVALYRFPRPRC